MKKTLIILLLCLASALPARSQHYIGARAGWGLGYGRFAPISSYTMKWVWGTWSAGVQWKYYGQVRYIGAVAAELEYLQRAYQQQASLDSENYTRRIYNTLNIPLIWHIHLNLADNRFRVFLNAGVWASWNMSAYEWTRVNGEITGHPYHMTLVRDNPLGYGLLGGVGFNYVIGKWELMLEARYYFSYGDIMRNNAIYRGNPVRSPLDNINVSLGFFYRIGNKPHTPVPPPWYARMIAKKEARNSERDRDETIAEALGTESAGEEEALEDISVSLQGAGEQTQNPDALTEEAVIMETNTENDNGDDKAE